MTRLLFPCLWFDGNAEEAADFYVSLIPDSQIDKVWRSPADTPSGPDGHGPDGRLHAGRPAVPGTQRRTGLHLQRGVSFVIECDDQAEVDRLWAALTADGGEPGPCGWLKDRFGLSWQIVPRRLQELLDDPDRARARRAMDAMLKMDKIDVAELEHAADAA